MPLPLKAWVLMATGGFSACVAEVLNLSLKIKNRPSHFHSTHQKCVYNSNSTTAKKNTQEF